MSVKNAPGAVLFRNSSLALLWLGQILSQAGSKMYAISLSWWFLEAIPGRAGLWIGILLVLSSLPGILFVKVIGRNVDRRSPKRLLQIADGIAGVACLLPLLFWNRVEIFAPLVCFVSFSLALCQAFLDPTLLRSISFVTRKEDQESATGLVSSTYSVAGFLGALIGAASIAYVGIKGAIYLNAASYFLALLFSSIAHFVAPPVLSGTATNEGAAVKAELEPFLKEKKILKKLLYLFGAVNFFATPILILVPIYTKRILGREAQDLAILEAALWCGVFLGSLSLPLWKFIREPLKLGATALGLFGASLMIPVLRENFSLYLLMLFTAGYFMGVNNVRFLSLFQEKIPLDIQGSFFARLTALSSFTFPIAFLLYGSLADVVDIRYLMVSQSLGILLLVLPLWNWSRREVLL